MTVQKAIRELPQYAEAELPPPQPSAPPIRHRIMTKEEFERRYGLLLILAAAFTIYTVLLSAWVTNRTEKRVWEEAGEHYADELQAYKDQQAYDRSAEYFLSGEASREAAMNQDAEAMSRDGGVWKTEAAFKAYCWNVVMRKLSPLYPNSIKEVLEDPGQFDYHQTEGAYSAEKFQWAKEVLEQAESGKLPARLTPQHLWQEMKDGGKDCVLHTSYNFYTGNDDPWWYLG